MYWNWDSHFQYWHPFPVVIHTVLFWIPLLLDSTSENFPFGMVEYLPKRAICHTGTGVTHVVPFLVLGSASSGTVIQLAPYRNWTLCAWSHFRYGALPVPVGSFTGPRTGTDSSSRSQFRYRALPVPVRSYLGSRTRTELFYVRWVSLLVGLGLGSRRGRAADAQRARRDTTTMTMATADDVDDLRRRRWRRRDGRRRRR